MSTLPDWARASIAWHRANGTLATPPPRGAYDAALKENSMPNYNNRLAPRGGYNGRTSRDQAQPPPTGMSMPGSFTANLDQGGENDETGFTPEQLAGVVEVCLNKFAAQDAEGESDDHNRAMRLLASVIAARHQNGNGNGRINGDRRMRSGYRMRSGDRHPAQDGAIRSLNAQGFLQRFPMAKNIRLSPSWRD
jgi:hypothetical protein